MSSSGSDYKNKLKYWEATWCQKFRAINKFIFTHFRENVLFRRLLTYTLQGIAVIFETEQLFLVSLKDLLLYPWNSSIFLFLNVFPSAHVMIHLVHFPKQMINLYFFNSLSVYKGKFHDKLETRRGKPHLLLLYKINWKNEKA